MMPPIPEDARPREVGIFIAYHALNVKSPEELAKLFHYVDRSAVDKILKSLRRKMTYQETYEFQAKRR